MSLNDKPAVGQKKLYFVNLGGYQKDKLNELHEFALLVASSPNEAKNKAKKILLMGASHQHKDNLMEVDDCLQINCINGMYIHLEATEEVFDLEPDWFVDLLKSRSFYFAGPSPYLAKGEICLLYTSPSPRDGLLSRMPSSA